MAIKEDENGIQINEVVSPTDDFIEECKSEVENGPTANKEEEDQDGKEKSYHTFVFETINIVDLIIVVVCGIALLIAIYDRYSDVAYSIVGGFMGYLGGGARGLLQKQLDTTRAASTRKK